LKESAKLGFASAVIPRAGIEAAGKTTLKTFPMGDVADLVAAILGGSRRHSEK
jgi:hypothetical protein